MRLKKEQLEKIKNDNHVNTLWSWSRVSSWHTSKYEWFLHYILNEEPDRLDCIYGREGNYSHDIIEKYYNKEITYEEMISEFEDSYNLARDIMGLKFNRSDSERDKLIGDKYYKNLQLFFKNHQPLPPLVTEDFAQIKIGNNILIGYIDAWYKDDDDNIRIIDWKTSSIYTGQNLIDKSGQLVCYALSFMQKGIPINKIKPCFNFLKYATITHEQANGKIKKTNVERRLLGEKLQSPSKMWLTKLGYGDDVNKYLKQILDTNDIECLPKEVKEKISISDCYVDVPLDEELINYWQKYVEDTISDIEDCIIMYGACDSDKIFYDSIEDIEKESYYYAVLSEYSANKNPCYAEYLQQLNNQSDLDLLGYI